MPDCTIIEDLTKILDISINEFFYGERISASEVERISEENLRRLQFYGAFKPPFFLIKMPNWAKILRGFPCGKRCQNLLSYVVFCSVLNSSPIFRSDQKAANLRFSSKINSLWLFFYSFFITAIIIFFMNFIIKSLLNGQRAELIDGKMYMMAPPNFRHQKIVMELSAVIHQYIKAHGGNCEVLLAPFAVFLNEIIGTMSSRTSASYAIRIS